MMRREVFARQGRRPERDLAVARAALACCVHRGRRSNGSIDRSQTEVDPDVLTETRKFVMKLAKKRGIDETPAAISEAAESLATAILAKAEDVRLWASGSDMPLPANFTDGADAWQQLLADGFDVELS